jgi:uncharacterized membrane-anchored protein
MIKNKLTLGIAIVILFQIAVLAGEYLSASIPLWTGKEIKIRTIPVDPRSLFRGNYALLRYEISRIPESEFPVNTDLRNGEKVYVTLKPGENELYVFDKATLETPGEGLFLRGRVENRWYDNNSSYYRIKYGIEAYFAPKDKAVKLERELAEGGIAVLMVTGSGKAALKSILPNQKN